MKVYFIDFNPFGETRNQHVDRNRFGPYSTKDKAEKVRKQILKQCEWNPTKNQVVVYSEDVDSIGTFTFGSGPYKTLHVNPNNSI